MVSIILGPEYDLARRLEKMERQLSVTRRNPVAYATAESSQADFSPNAAPAAFGQQSAVVPDGYTSCIVYCGVTVAATNSTASHGELYVTSSVDGTSGAATQVSAPAGALGSGSAMANRTLYDLVAGETVTVGAVVWTGTGVWASHAENIARVSAVFLFAS